MAVKKAIALSQKILVTDLLRLPFFNSMTDEQQEAVIEALLEFDAW
jgi:dTDP-4-amino-4,6-dideoxygalactose transaminase